MARIAVVGGTGLNKLSGAVGRVVGESQTPYGAASAPLQQIEHAGHQVLFLARHGQPHRYAPHAINYRANVWMLAQEKVDVVIAVNAVGGIHDTCVAGAVVVPSQIIDYTWGRESSFSDHERLLHVDFTEPYDQTWRMRLLAADASLRTERAQVAIDGGVYGCTQGPRLESAAEIARLERDGCTVVGMTGMPEAGLAREVDLAYVALCLVVNLAAGKGSGLISADDIRQVIDQGMSRVERLVLQAVEMTPA